ncbi:phosphatidylcholine synthase [bacterium MnTg02]|nr:phosphatidylcholine synthase [bacterium MnTg02]
MPLRVLIPNIFTLIGLCAGLTAMRMAIEGRYDIAIAAIVLAAVFDALDGRIARLLKATSRFGAELDSLADFVNFGVAPAIIIFTWALGELKSLGWIIVLVFALCAALRLARFNVALDADQPDWKGNYFVGVPAPAAAIIVLLPLYLDGLDIPNVQYFTPVILVYTLVIGILMISWVPTYSGKAIGQKVGRQYVLPIFVLAVMFAAVLVTYPFTTLTCGSLAYLAFIPVSFMRYRKIEKRTAQDAKSKNGKSKIRKEAPAPSEAPAEPHSPTTSP